MALRLVIFDLDGTLVDSGLDFDAIRHEIGLTPGTPILEAMTAMADHDRERASDVLDRYETAAAGRARLMPGAAELLDGLRASDVKVAILTRNSRTSVERVCRRHGLRFDAVVAREDKHPKPHPGGVHHLMQTCGAAADETVVVGDFRFDVEAGNAAGCRTVALLSDPQKWQGDGATWKTHTLDEVGRILAELIAEE